MVKPITILAATGAAVLGAGSLASATNKPARPPRSGITMVAVLGARVNVPYRKFVKAYAYCPKGFYVTGGGAYNGAITEIVSSPLPNMRGWFVDGTNDDPLKRTFQHRADAICVKGTSSIPIATAANASPLHQAEADFAARHRSGGGPQ
jgi:hypothetical protein